MSHRRQEKSNAYYRPCIYTGCFVVFIHPLFYFPVEREIGKGGTESGGAIGLSEPIMTLRPNGKCASEKRDYIIEGKKEENPTATNKKKRPREVCEGG